MKFRNNVLALLALCFLTLSLQGMQSDNTQQADGAQNDAPEIPANNQPIDPLLVLLPSIDDDGNTVTPCIQMQLPFNHVCIIMGDLEGLKRYFAHCVVHDIPFQVNSPIRSFNNQPMLFVASQLGHTEIVRYLLELGASDEEIIADTGKTALGAACHRGHILIVELLLKKTNRFINTSNYAGGTPLHIACSNKDAVFICRNGKNKTIVGLLLEHGAHINSITTENVTPLHVACVTGCTTFIRELVEYAKEHDILSNLINIVTKHGFTALGLIIPHQNIEIIQFLLDNGADAELHGENTDQTPFMANCFYDNPEIGQLLLDHGANLDSRKSNGFTPLHAACQEGNINMVKFLLDKNVDVNATTVKKNTPLHVACNNKHNQIVNFLLEHGASINIQNAEQFRTPLWISCLYGDIESVYTLIKHGADQTLAGNFSDKNDQNKMLTPHEVALEHEFFSLANFITALNNNDESIYVCPTDRCSICFEDCEDGSLGIAFSCGHTLHASCAQLYTDRNCPLCRAETNVDSEDIITCKKVIIFKSHVPAQSNEKKRKRIDVEKSEEEESDEETQQPGPKRPHTDTSNLQERTCTIL